MSTFKEIKKREKIKAWESKIRRLYACESITEDDIKFLNVQYDYYKLRKSLTYLWGFSAAGITYFLPIINELFWAKRWFFTAVAALVTYQTIKKRNRIHYETIIMPYFEKYYIK
jgi:hypothetical protein